MKPQVITAAVASAMLLVGLAGCAPAESATTRPSSTVVATSPESEAEVSVLDAVEVSYQKWLSEGMTEEVDSSGDRYVLTYEPGDEFVAGLYNVELDDVIPIEQPELFTVYSAWIMLQDDATTIVEGDNQITLTNSNYGDFTVFIEEGLIVSGEAVDGSWTGVFRYSPDRAVLDLLATALEAEQ
ncbi:MAG: hypothetical protein K9G13_06595 [Aquiluna sp.]|nr:hypothetical protein [Aquiluna sp.]MCF8546185.1 hypothetical protein [Aquiluna sp.]